MAAACCVMVACVGTFSAVNLLSPDDVIAGKNDPVMTEEGNNTIVKEGQGQPGENLGGDTMIETDWNKVAVIKKSYPDMLIPGYVPDGYEFKELQVEVTELVQNYAFMYEKEGQILRITQTDGTDLKMIFNYNRTFNTPLDIKIMVKEDEEKSAHFLIEESLCAIGGDLSDKQYSDIADKLER